MRTDKRRLIVYTLAIALAVTTVVYAVMQTTLNVSGTVVKKGASLNIYFANLKTPSLSGNGKSTSATLSSTNIEFTIELSEPLDSVTYYFDVVNSGTINAKLDSITYSGVTAASNKNIGTTFTYSDGTEIKEGDFLTAGVTRNLKLKIEYKDVDYIYSTDNKFTIKVTLVYMQYDGDIPIPGGDTSVIAECNHSCTGPGQTCTSADITTTSGIRCKVKTSSSSTETTNFYVLGDDGTNLTMLAESSFTDWPYISMVNGITSIQFLSVIDTFALDNLPEFTYSLSEGIREPDLGTITARARLPKRSDFENLGISISWSTTQPVPNWAAAPSGSSYWLSSKYSQATSATESEEPGNFYHVCVIGNTLDGGCGRFMNDETIRGIRPVIVIPRSKVKVNY